MQYTTVGDLKSHYPIVSNTLKTTLIVISGYSWLDNIPSSKADQLSYTSNDTMHAN